MKDINIGQFVSRFFNQDFAKKSSAPVENFNLQPKAMPERQVNTQEIIAKQLFNLNQDITNTRAQLAQLNNLDKNLLLKDLFNLPKDIKDFLLMMSDTNSKALSNQEITNLLTNGSLDLSKLMLFIQQNGKEALSKLFQMVANYNQLGATVKQDQLSELTALINACVAGAAEKDSQALKTMMLLYLPWLPLTDNKAFKLEIENSIGAEASRDDSITILISTINFGNIQVLLTKPDKCSIGVNITCSQEFPVEKIKLAISEEAVNYNVQANISESIIEKADNKIQDSQLQISMKVSPGVNPFLILMANSVIKVITAVDNADNIRQARKEML